MVRYENVLQLHDQVRNLFKKTFLDPLPISKSNKNHENLLNVAS